MGLFDDDDLELDELLDAVKKYPPCVAELNEANVQAIFNRCLAKDGSPVLTSLLFPSILGNMDRNDYGAVDFDKDTILKSKLTIAYLFGQLNAVHALQDKNTLLTIENFSLNYSGIVWSENEKALLELLYLGKCAEIDFIHPFNARKNNTTRFGKKLVPTLSPKDPAFPAWWEAHRAEWEG